MRRFYKLMEPLGGRFGGARLLAEYTDGVDCPTVGAMVGEEAVEDPAFVGGAKMLTAPLIVVRPDMQADAVRD